MPVIQTRYGGLKFRSRVEARWAAFFDLMDIRVDYEPEGFVLPSGAYLPDFYCHAFGMFLEVKGAAPSVREMAKCAELAVASGHDVLLLIGAPASRFQILRFDLTGQRPDLYALAQDRRVAAGFWLVAEDDAKWLGPTSEGVTRDGPMFTGALEQAVSIAQGERFDGITRYRRFPALQHEPWRLSA